MSFYRNRYLTEGCKKSCSEEILPSVDCDQLIDMDQVTATFEESSIEAAARICYENTVNLGKLLEAATIDEMLCLESGGVEALNEGERFDAFIEKAKSFFKAVWEKIQSLVKKVTMQFNSWFVQDKEFIKKYKKDINAAMNTKDAGDKEVEVFDYLFYTTDAPASNISKFTSKESAIIPLPAELNQDVTDQAGLDSLKQKYESQFTKDEMTKVLNELRGACLGKNSEVEANEFGKEIKIFCQGDDSKQSVPIKSMVPKCMAFLEDSAKVKKSLNTVLKESKSAIDKSIKECEDMKKALGKSLKGEASIANQAAGIKQNIATKQIELLKSAKNMLVQYIGVMLNELKACSRQSKFVCTKIVTMKAAKNESTAYSTEGSLGSGIIESVQFE